MSGLSKLFGAKYDDAQLTSRAKIALEADPLIVNSDSLVVSSKGGVITLSGPVASSREKDRIEGVIRTALTSAGLKHERIVNDLRLPEGAH